MTAEATPHHLLLTEEMIEKRGALAKVNPPLRTEADRQALVEGIKDGTIDIIATDHAPHTTAEKQRPYADAPAGISGFETALGSLLWLVQSKQLTLTELIACLTCKPAAILNKPLGSFVEGTAANVTIIDPNKEWVVDINKFVSLGKNTPLAGAKLTGKVVATIYQGNLVYKDDSVNIGLRLMKKQAYLVLADGSVLRRIFFRGRGGYFRRGRLQYEHDRVSGNAHRPLVCRADSGADLSAHRQLRDQ